jgi:heparinase II/III-like protein
MKVFNKPHIAGVFKRTGGRKPGKRVYPYPEKMIAEYDVFPRLILDGGAFFYSAEYLGGGDGEHFVAALEEGTLLEPWTVRNKIQWDKAYDDTAEGACRTAFEQHVWLNRLYFLLPIAQLYQETRDETQAKLWLAHFTDWSKAHPYPQTALAEGADRSKLTPEHHAKFCWHDMQVTWRLLVLIHSIPYLERAKSLKKKDWHAIYAAIHQHARHVYAEAKPELELGRRRGNHFLQKGVALIYTGALFPEMPEAEEFIELGRAIVEQQMKSEILADGGSIEASPSYSHFIARLYLDAYLLLTKNRLPEIKGLKTCIAKQYKFLDETTPPTGLSLQWSDSYALDADADLDLVAKLFPFTRSKRTRSVSFSDSGVAVLRNKRLAVFADGMALGLWHHHAGKPNIVIYADDEPLVVDSGCCNYDLELREGWIKTAAAHNVVLVSTDPGGRDLLGAADAPAIRLVGSEQKRTHSAFMMTHEFAGGDLRYQWTRTVMVRAKAVQVIDRVEASAPVYARQVFHLAPANVGLSGDRRTATVQRIGGDIQLRQDASSTGAFELTWRPAIGADNALTCSPEVSSRGYGREIQFQVRFELP